MDSRADMPVPDAGNIGVRAVWGVRKEKAGVLVGSWSVEMPEFLQANCQGAAWRGRSGTQEKGVSGVDSWLVDGNLGMGHT